MLDDKQFLFRSHPSSETVNKTRRKNGRLKSWGRDAGFSLTEVFKRFSSSFFSSYIQSVRDWVLHRREYFTPSRCVIGSWGRQDFGKYSRGGSRTVSFDFEQSGSPLPAWGLIILVTRRSAIFGIVSFMTVTLSGRHFNRYQFYGAG